MNATLQQHIGARRLGAIGWGLIVLAFALPYVSEAMGNTNAAGAGYQVGQMAMALVVLVAVTSLALKGRSALAQSYGRVVIGVLLTLWALGTAGQQLQQSNAQKAFLIESQKMHAQQTARFVELGKRFEAIDLTTVLTPETITTAEGIAAARQTVSKYKALLAERKALLSTTFSESERFFNTNSPSEADKRAALASMERGKVATVKLYSELDAVQSAVANSISDVLDWAAMQKGKLAAKNGKFVFSSAEQQNELTGLLSKLGTAETKQQQVLQAAAVAQQKAQASTREDMDKLQQMVK